MMLGNNLKLEAIGRKENWEECLAEESYGVGDERKLVTDCLSLSFQPLLLENNL